VRAWKNAQPGIIPQNARDGAAVAGPQGEVGQLSCIRKSESFAPALKSKMGHPFLRQGRPEGGRYKVPAKITIRAVVRTGLCNRAWQPEQNLKFANRAQCGPA
jgi:hypothetical protein